MNKKLFEIRIIIKQRTIPAVIGGCLIVVAAICFVAAKYECSFLKFHGEAQYKPLNDVAGNKGFYGKVNFMLAKAFEDSDYKLKSLAAPNNILEFYIPDGSFEYLASLDEIRLTGFHPKARGDKEFYYNSHFKKYIELQQKYPNRKYFIIEWEEYGENRNNKSYKIKSIKIDETLENVSLIDNEWKGEVTFDDPFAQIDTAVVYIIYNNIPLPLFGNSMSVNNFLNSESNNNSPLSIKSWRNKSLEYMEKMYYDTQQGENSKTFNIDFGNDMRVEFVNIRGTVRLKPYNTVLIIQNRAKTDTVKAQRNDYVLSKFDHTIKITVKNAKGKRDLSETLYVSNKVFKVASAIANFGLAQERKNISKHYTDLSVQQFIKNIEASAKQTEKPKVGLSANIFLSKILETEMANYINSIKNSQPKVFDQTDEWQMSICLMDITTGEIIASPFYSNKFDRDNINDLTETRNFNLERHHIGSTFKPLLTFAAAAKYPSLKDFVLQSTHTKYGNSTQEEKPKILGYLVQPYGRGKNKNGINSLFWDYIPIGRETFLSISHDNYPIAMTMLALTENNTENDRLASNLLNNTYLQNDEVNNLHKLLGNKGTRIKYESDTVRFNQIYESSFINLLGNVYNVNTQLRDSVMWYSDSLVWRNMADGGKPQSLFPDNVNLCFNWINTFIDFENMIIGQGNNFWTNIKLAEAYSRLLSKRKTEASFMKNAAYPYLFENPNALFNAAGTNFLFNRTQQNLNTAWSDFMETWRKSVTKDIRGNTLNVAYNRLTKAVPLFESNYYFYCKTGTMDNEAKSIKRYVKNVSTGKTELTDGWWDEGMFVFGITNKETMPKGIVGVVYIKRITKKDPNGAWGASSATARDFLTEERFKKIMFYNKNRFNTERR
jgi:hypothetical protein